jgi:hypothetical protein
MLICNAQRPCVGCIHSTPHIWKDVVADAMIKRITGEFAGDFAHFYLKRSKCKSPCYGSSNSSDKGPHHCEEIKNADL